MFFGFYFVLNMFSSHLATCICSGNSLYFK